MRGCLSTLGNDEQVGDRTRAQAPRRWLGLISLPWSRAKSLMCGRTRSSVGVRLAEFVTPARERTRDASRFHVVAYDFGLKHNSLRNLAALGCKVTVVPAHTSAEDVTALKPDGVWLSNGPGDPEPLTGIVEQYKKTDRPLSDIWNLSGASTDGSRVWRPHLQAAVWASRRESPGEGFDDRTR